jgi:hypothetical protein
MEFKGIEEIEIKNWLFGPCNGETPLEFIYIENLQLLVDVCNIENMTNLGGGEDSCYYLDKINCIPAYQIYELHSKIKVIKNI